MGASDSKTGFSSNGHNVRESAGAPEVSNARRKTPWPLVVVAFIFVLVPFLAWYGTWFGRTLNDEQIDSYLDETSKPRHIQHALSQIGERISRGEPMPSRWNDKLVALTENPVADVRMTAAWVMGEEHRSETFRAALLRLLDDPEPIVRRNAALALVRFGDPLCLSELRAMLRPYPVLAKESGRVQTALTESTPVSRESLLVRYETAAGEVGEVRSPLPGKVERARVTDGGEFTAGAELFRISPDPEQVRDALVGLYYFGEARDLAQVEAFSNGVEGMPDAVKKQAALTAEAIKRRAVVR